jgi:ATP-dependent 26S proteasome regulatory subunit
MDGISDDSSKGIVVVGATNVIHVLDPALLRPGRFDQCLYIGPPDIEARKEIFKLEMRKLAHSPDVFDAKNIEDIAYCMEGKTGAEISAICRESAMLAIEEDAEMITMEHILRATESAQLETLAKQIQGIQIY